MAPRFLQRLHFTPDAAPACGNARPAIVQYHPQATSEVGKRQGYVIAHVESWAAEHGPSLAAGPEALDLLSRIVEAFDAGEISLRSGAHGLVGEARILVTRAAPPEGAVNPNGTVRTRTEREEA